MPLAHVAKSFSSQTKTFCWNSRKASTNTTHACMWNMWTKKNGWNELVHIRYGRSRRFSLFSWFHVPQSWSYYLSIHIFLLVFSSFKHVEGKFKNKIQISKNSWIQFIVPKNGKSNTLKSKAICDFDPFWQSKLGAKKVVLPLKIKLLVVNLSLELLFIFTVLNQNTTFLGYLFMFVLVRSGAS